MNIVTKTANFLKKTWATWDIVNFRREMDAGGLPSSKTSGQNVNVDTALQLSTVWACVRLIAETISTLPLFLYEKRGDLRVLAPNHPLYSLLHDQPNADMTAVEFWEAVVSQLCLWGNAFVLKSFNGQGVVIAITPLRPDLMGLRRNSSGTITYLYSDPYGAGVKEYTERDIWHVKGFGTDGLIGRSPIRNGLRSMGLALATDAASSSMFTDGMRAQGIIAIKEYLKPDQRAQYKEKVNDGRVGSPATGMFQLLENDAKFYQTNMNPDDAQMLETRQFNVEDLCRWFGIPPAMIGHGTAVSNWGTGREQINLNFIQYVLRAYMVRIEQGIKKSLLTPAERTRFFAEFSVEGLLRADSETRARVYAQLVQNGLKTRNEVRLLENDPPLAGGDELTVQSNLIPLTLLGKITNTAQQAKSALLDWLGLGEDKDKTDGLPD